MKIISQEQIEALNISPLQCYEWVEQALKGKSTALLPTKISLQPDMKGVFYNTMPVIIPDRGRAGLKLVTRYPNRKPSLDAQILLYDLPTGEHLAVMDGNWITAMRTGAVAAHSIKLLARKDFSVIGMIGLGSTAKATFRVLMELYSDKPLVVKLLRYKEQHELFAREFAEHENVEFIYCETYKEVVVDSDVVISAVTFFEDDICATDDFKEGVLVMPIHTRGFLNCDLSFEKVFADDTGHVEGFKYFSKFKRFAEVADVIAGKKAGRENDKERIIVYNIGIALHDVNFASEIYNTYYLA